jgi:hypothetical protein
LSHLRLFGWLIRLVLFSFLSLFLLVVVLFFFFFSFFIVIVIVVVSALAIRSTVVLLVLLMCSMSLTVVVMQEKVVAPRALVQPGESMGGREEGRKYPLFSSSSQISSFGVMSCPTRSTEMAPRSLFLSFSLYDTIQHEEKKKLDQLRKEIEEERQLLELQRLQEESTGRKRVEKLDWMYASPATADGGALGGAKLGERQMEDYLLGKKRVDEVLKLNEENVSRKKGFVLGGGSCLCANLLSRSNCSTLSTLTYDLATVTTTTTTTITIPMCTTRTDRRHLGKIPSRPIRQRRARPRLQDPGRPHVSDQAARTGGLSGHAQRSCVEEAGQGDEEAEGGEQGGEAGEEEEGEGGASTSFCAQFCADGSCARLTADF